MSTSDVQAPQVRGFVPPRSDQERMVMRRAEDLCASAEKRWSARYTGFLSDREQDLCAAALNRVGCDWYRFDGGYDGAERKLLCLVPFGIECEPPTRFVKVAYSHLCAQPPAHRDCLGAILGLAMERSCIGDLIPSPDEHCIYVAVLQEMAGVLCRELRQAGQVSVRTTLCEEGKAVLPMRPPPKLQTASVASLRLDAVLAAFLNCSRSQAEEYVRTGHVEINHIPQEKAGTPVYEQDLFTVRGKGRFRLEKLGGKSRKDRQWIEYYQY